MRLPSSKKALPCLEISSHGVHFREARIFQSIAAPTRLSDRPLASCFESTMPRASARSAAATRRENQKNGIISPQEAAELAADPTYIDATYNTIDNSAFRASLGTTFQNLPFITSAGPNIFVSHAPMASKLYFLMNSCHIIDILDSS